MSGVIFAGDTIAISKSLSYPAAVCHNQKRGNLRLRCSLPCRCRRCPPPLSPPLLALLLPALSALVALPAHRRRRRRRRRHYPCLRRMNSLWTCPKVPHRPRLQKRFLQDQPTRPFQRMKFSRSIRARQPKALYLHRRPPPRRRRPPPPPLRHRISSSKEFRTLCWL